MSDKTLLKKYVKFWYGNQIHEYFKNKTSNQDPGFVQFYVDSTIDKLTDNELQELITYLKDRIVPGKRDDNKLAYIGACELKGLSEENATNNVTKFMQVLIFKLNHKMGTPVNQTIFETPDTRLLTYFANALETYEALMAEKPVPVPAAATTTKEGHDPAAAAADDAPDDTGSLGSAQSEEARPVPDKDFTLIDPTKKGAKGKKSEKDKSDDDDGMEIDTGDEKGKKQPEAAGQGIPPPPTTSLRLHATFTTLTTENKDPHGDYKDPKIKRSHLLHGRNMDPLPYQHQVIHYSRNTTHLGRNKVNVRQKVNLNELKRVLF